MARKLSGKRPTRRKTAPLNWGNIEFWERRLDEHGHDDPKKLRGVDVRLLTIAPAIEGLICGLKGYTDTPTRRRLMLVGIARQAVGTFHPQGRSRGDMNRALVLCDWMLRCALPIWLDRLPNWCSAKDSAATLRALRAICWSCQIVQGLSTLAPAWAALSENYRDRGTQAEREVIWEAARCADAAMRVIADALVVTMSQSWHGQDSICRRVTRMAFNERGEEDPAVVATIPALVKLLLEVQPGDSRSSVADRCVWARPSKKSVAAA